MKRNQFRETGTEKDAIVAISTPLGIGGIGIVRMSGPQSIDIASKIFRYKGKIKKNPHEFHSHHIYYGTIIQPGEDTMVDEVLLTVMRKPKTYTREDIVEINCHGGFLVLNKVLAIVNKLGVRIAEPGEFTKLAFLNGRIDLSQAEAVIDLIKASNEKSLKSSLNHLAGGLREEIAHLKNRIIDLTTRIEAPLDFPDQGIIEMKNKEIKKVIEKCLFEVNELLDTVKYGQIIKEGINTIILGKTNVGKSSLFNMLLKKNKSIVTSLPGTTRDLIEGTIVIKGFTFHLIDTAGMKDPENIIEQVSLKKVSQHMEFAQLFLVMFDINQPLDAHDITLIDKIESFNNRNINKIIVLNKIDLPSRIDHSELQQRLGINEFIRISVKKRMGIDILIEKMVNQVLSNIDTPEEGLIISNQRHLEYLLKVKKGLADLVSGLEEGIPVDFVLMDLKYITSQLANITGEAYDDEMLSKIFSQFCIGK
ncbi:MAG: tRNA uridine-5-carboxymethylaminomethyl(34) synthesis GTPase MnmE [Atribacterota bacterium]|nr:tRNA uridine-5-carboxymethylaminomethyl(34) synthesis GTPase MnmE [Atribacterota bacterium]MDD4895961.1 tRNA uridine-5-carboxymethylaminomethyl(34) synthesis GTPase MnmE [Atribacterota bacterium]MDD5638079.1 tRNA uridine-5-carboxymethylaminomethyl(34) synthesis GTPase MnmE [Atribacterota bacterium]